MKIVVLSSHTLSLFWFRMDMMKDLIKHGHSVIAMGSEPEVDWKSKFSENNIEYRQLNVERNGINPVNDLRTLKELYYFIRTEKPDKIFTYQAKTVVYGSIAAKLNGIHEVYSMIAGLGSIFRGVGIKNYIVKIIMKFEFKLACKLSKKVFFQNIDDKNEFINKGLAKENQVVIINGSGVNLEYFSPEPLPIESVFLFIGRLIKDKGVMEYLEGCKEIKKKFPKTRCLLIGPYDSNPSAVQPDELMPYITNGIIEYYGEQSDVRPFIAECSTFVLPSYHEGTPKTVLEAMAMGRSIITSDAPGCRETVLDGDNGYLIPVKNIKALVEKMEFFILNPNVSAKMGKCSLEIVKQKYDVNIVNQSIMREMGII